MHTLTIQIDDSIYQKFISLLESLPKSKLKVKQDEYSQDPLRRELQERLDAIDSGTMKMQESEAFWQKMDAKIDAYRQGR